MTKDEAKQQVENFFRKLGINGSIFEEKKFVKATIGEAVVGFEFVEAESALKADALIYRFRKNPQEETIKAIFAEERISNTAGGKLQFETESLSLFLEQIFTEKIPDEEFYAQINNLAQASLIWSKKILPQTAEKIHGR